MNKNLGFIGCGNMGSAMAKGIIKSGLIKPENLYLYDKNLNISKELAKELDANQVDSAIDVSQNSDLLVLAVKPNVYPQVLEEIKDKTKENSVIIVIAVGISFDDIYSKLGDVKVVRVQPSTPALVGESDTTIFPDNKIKKEEVLELVELMKSFGKCEILPENLMDVVPSIASSAPAYALMLISAMADAGCYQGFPRNQAINLSAQAVLGAAKLVLETGEDPDVLKNKICTPGGTTIEAVCSLEENGFRGTIIDAVNKCAEKSKSMLKNENLSY